MTKRLKTVLIILGISVVLVLGARFFFGGNEDTWICQEGDWVMHGNPSDPAPDIECS